MASQLAKNLKQPALDFLSFVNASPTCIYDHLSPDLSESLPNHICSIPCGSIGKRTPRQGWIPGNQGQWKFTDPILLQLLTILTGKRFLVVNMPTWRQILSDTKQLHDRGFCCGEEVAGML